VFEVSLLDNDTGTWLARGQPREQIQQRFREQGASSIFQDALGKAAEGLTTMQEIARLQEQSRASSPRVSDLG
jgi:type II secretory ATPase GspE/PulE/Tfp pilus assembly ATPase PilB-like protein